MTTTSSRPHLLPLTLGSIGVVYGDIGTSPLYAFRESLAAISGENGFPPAEAVIGLLSLVLWSLIIVVTLKYVVMLLRADNHGEGGILSLMALAQEALGRRTGWILLCGMAGAALFYGDAIITPAISVLSAVEGLKLVTHDLEPYILPIAITIIVLLFLVQRRGTNKVARFFGPIMLLWFLALAWGGVLHILDTPHVWQAFNPYRAIDFITHHGWAGIIALGAVVLAVTGAEALYADLGHFGKKPIRLAWLAVVMPSLMLNYIGQAALVLSHPEAAHNSFFLLYPEWALLPMVILSTIATVIASQAVITGAYSLTHQAVQLSLMPRLRVEYTSESHIGQIYIPQVNWMLMIGVIVLIELFRSSSNLASAYGIAVTGTMIASTLLVFVVMRHVWRWPLATALAITAPLLIIDLAFFGANLTKLHDGGYMPVLVALFIIMLMRIWVRGNRVLYAQLENQNQTLDRLITDLNRTPPERVSGTAIFLSSNINNAPPALLHNLRHNKILHAQNILLNLRFVNTPYVQDEQRVSVEAVNEDFTRVYMCFGYMESPNIALGLRLLRSTGFRLDMMNTSFFISRRNIMPSATFGLRLWQDHIFIAMANNASDAADYFHIPRSRVVELGVQLTV